MKNILYVIIFSINFNAWSQNTVGTITSSNDMYDGYTLFTPGASNETYLIDNCGRVVNQWTSNYPPGNSCYLLENGNLLRAGKIANSSITFGGVGGLVQLFDWDGNLLWQYNYSNSMVTQHHDVYPLPNGNILMLAVTTMLQQEAVLAGRNPALITESKIFNEQVLELEPVGTNQANIVWEWNIKDHLIQDFDSSKDNFGVIADHPELLDFNFNIGDSGFANWLHFNSIQYNADLDQIILSSRLMSEFYIIDHSTTTAEAASHSGGRYGKGGDLLYRWGNPEVYDKGDASNRTLYSQHYPHWIAEGLTDAGKIILFNNGPSRRFSSVDILSPPMSAPGVYIYDSVTGYGPSVAEWSFTTEDPDYFYSSILSGAERLPNGNTLICDGDSGFFFEIDPTNNVVWEYKNPDSANGIVTQGDNTISNLVFRAEKYPTHYPAFTGRDLSPGNPIELNPNLTACENLGVEETNLSDLKIYPNPTTNNVFVESNFRIEKIEVYNTLGSLVEIVSNSNKVDLNSMDSGIYFMTLHYNNAHVTKRIIKQ
ncbi:MAG: aryl-sulfate sulfotransferase [Aquaticitalea sp.]